VEQGRLVRLDQKLVEGESLRRDAWNKGGEPEDTSRDFVGIRFQVLTS
jgi:hypothetical protein